MRGIELEKYIKEKNVELGTFFEKAERLDFSVGIEGGRTNQNIQVILSKVSPYGQDFNAYLNIPITADNHEIKSILDDYIEGFDVSSETYLWLDSDGHGMNGAPYDMKDVYEDMEACRDYLDELLELL